MIVLTSKAGCYLNVMECNRIERHPSIPDTVRRQVPKFRDPALCSTILDEGCDFEANLTGRKQNESETHSFSH